MRKPIESNFYLVRLQQNTYAYPEELEQFKRFLPIKGGLLERTALAGTIEDAYALHSAMFNLFASYEFGDDDQEIVIEWSEVRQLRDKCMRALSAKTEEEAKDIMPVDDELFGFDTDDYGESYREYLNKAVALLSEIMKFMDRHEEECWLVKYVVNKD